jgi:hypothetical protein
MVRVRIQYRLGEPPDLGRRLCSLDKRAPPGNPIVQVGSPAWTITSTVPLTLYVQDMFAAVDQYTMFNNLANIGTTSADANNPGINCGNDITACIASAGNSRGTFILPAGADSLTGERLCQGNNCMGGAGVFELTPVAVPAPKLSPLPVLGAAVLALAFKLFGWVRRRDVSPDAVA